MEKWAVIIIVVLLIPVLLVGGVVIVKVVDSREDPPDFDDDDPDEYGDLGSNLGSSHPNYDPHNLNRNYTEADGPSFRVTDYASEDSTYFYNFSLALDGGRFLKTMEFKLNWTDEPDKNTGPVDMPNEPDGFRLKTEWLKGENVQDSQELKGDAWGENNPGQPGYTALEIDVIHTMLEVQRGEGQWTVSLDVSAGDYGKTDKPVYPTQDDPGNDFTLIIETTVYVPKGV